MQMKLISEDRELYRLCREILCELPGPASAMSMVALEENVAADLCVWDFQPGMPIPQNLGSNGSLAKHLFIVNRKDLATLREKAGTTDITVLLKPVTRPTLAAFLGFASSIYQDRHSATTALRADRDEMLQCLIQTNLKLQEYDQERTHFLTRVVHDFRAPLTALSGYCGLLLGEALGGLTENQKEVLERMQHSAKRLSHMAAAMFQLSVGRQIRVRPLLRKGDLRQCLDQVLHEIMPFAEDKRLSITMDLKPCEEALYFESAQIEQVLLNILDNACKFTPKAGSIVIRGYPVFRERRLERGGLTGRSERRNRAVNEPNMYRIDICDSGAAIPPEHLGRIFEEYTSYAGGKDRSGGGLGLAICRMIITQHDGYVWAENTDFGPILSFVLPLYKSEPAQAAGLEEIASVKYAEVM